MILIPAIDLMGGTVVRLEQGRYDKVTRYARDPVETARAFRAAGATHLHIVDLDGAREGEATNHVLIERIIAASGLFVEVGGGIRTASHVEHYLAAGVGRVILGSVLVDDPAFVRDMLARFGGKIALGIDMLRGEVMTRGWEYASGEDGLALSRRMAEAGARTLIVTDIEKDGKLSGTNLDLYRRLVELEGPDIIASGGITDYDDIRKLRAIGVEGAIVGKALYDGRMTPEDAIRVAAEG